MLIPLKHKYTVHKPFGRYRSGHNDGNKRIKRAGSRGYSDPYVYGEHILLLKEGRKKVMIHAPK